ncbi:MAG: hypothetical protein Q9174_003132, partial [Haloplaca sp. 1 TL-2023]
SPPIEISHQQAERAVKSSPATAPAQNDHMWKQRVAAKDERISIQKDQIVYLNCEIEDLGKNYREADTKLLNVHQRASECHRKAFCKESESKDKCGKQSSPKFNIKEHVELQLRKLQEYGVLDSPST